MVGGQIGRMQRVNTPQALSMTNNNLEARQVTTDQNTKHQQTIVPLLIAMMMKLPYIIHVDSRSYHSHIGHHSTV